MSQQQAYAQVALVTGASSGIGQRIAQRLHEHGFRVFGTSRHPEAARDPFEMVALDVTDEASVERCVRTVLERAGRIDVLVNNAGVELVGAVEEIDVEEARWLFETNFFGVVRMVRAVLPGMRAAKRGTIINISSLAGLTGVPFQSMYAASKHALEGYTESLSFEVRSFGIRVALVEPGFFRSALGARKHVGSHPLLAYQTERDQAIRVWEEFVRNGPDPEPVARRVVNIARGRAHSLRHLVGQASGMVRFKMLMPDRLIAWGTRRTFGLDNRLPADLLRLPRRRFER